ncbi:MAG: 16S rRNA processing protein RimM [Clostridia bacterium]|nr:16S rRNA processing protein RimM [Clostridia bacterium]
MKNEYLECGKIRSPHGVRGILNVECWCDSPRVLTKQKRVFILGRDGTYKQMNIVSASAASDRVLLGLEGIDSREAAQGYKNTVLYLHRNDIPVPKGAMLIADMIGLPVLDFDTGAVYGRVSDVTDGVRYKLFTVVTEEGREVILPGVDEFIKEISEEGGVRVSLIPGFFDA